MASISDIQTMLDKLHLSLGEEIRNEIKSSSEKLENKLDSKLSELENKNKIMSKKIENLEVRNKVLEEKQMQHEKNMRKQNIIIYGLISEACSFQEQLSSVLSLFNTQLQIETSKEEINFISRIGPKGNVNNPILVGFTSLIKKGEILRSCNKLKGFQISICEDFPKEVTIKRKELIPQLKQLRQEKSHVVLKYDKLIVDGKIYEPNSINDKNDKKRDLRSLEVDPLNNTQSSTNTEAKQRRVNSLSRPRGRPPSKTRAANSQPNSRSTSPQVMSQILSQPIGITASTSNTQPQGPGWDTRPPSLK